MQNYRKQDALLSVIMAAFLCSPNRPQHFFKWRVMNEVSRLVFSMVSIIVFHNSAKATSVICVSSLCSLSSDVAPMSWFVDPMAVLSLSLNSLISLSSFQLVIRRLSYKWQPERSLECCTVHPIVIHLADSIQSNLR